MRSSLAFVALVALTVVFAGALSAQESSPADLVGTWVLNLTKSKPDKRFPITSQTLVITYSGQTIQFDYTTDGKPLSFTYIVDGKEHTTPMPAPPPPPNGTKQPPNPMFRDAQNIEKAQWKKGALEITVLSQMGPTGYSVTSTFLSEHWTLSSDGKTLTEKTGSDFDSSHLYVFDRQ
ncbi:MAG TPA: hypothetical protein VEJ38_01245 [Candidatus Acidoferrales bacterium]|nr:hypothetical protein [Candidatus Acidoferrales bacterium]